MKLDIKQIEKLTFIFGFTLFGIALIFSYTGDYETTIEKLSSVTVTIVIVSAGIYEGLKRKYLNESK